MLIFLLVARAIPNDEEAGITDLGPTITYADDKSPVLPLVDLKILPPKVVTELLEAFVKAAWSKLFIAAHPVLLSYLGAEHAHPSDSTAEIPWAALSDDTDRYIASTCLPTGLKSLNPATMDLSEVYRFYDHVISAQSTPNGKNRFKFTRHDKISSTPSASSITPLTAGTVAAVRVSASPLSAAQGDREGGVVDTESSTGEVREKRRRGRGNGKTQR
jgi:hypothetical protein